MNKKTCPNTIKSISEAIYTESYRNMISVRKIITLTLTTLILSTSVSYAQLASEPETLNINAGERLLSKFPIIFAFDQGLFEKYALIVDLRLNGSQFTEAVRTADRFQDKDVDIVIDVHGYNLMSQITQANKARMKAIGGLDCTLRSFVLGPQNSVLPYDFKGKWIGVSERYSPGHFTAYQLARLNGLDPVMDFGILLNGRSVHDIESKKVDVAVTTELNGYIAESNGYIVLVDADRWELPYAGSSILVSTEWLDIESNANKALNFLRAVSEAQTSMTDDKMLTVSVIKKWYGISETALLDKAYEEVASIAKTPEICTDGIKNVLDTYNTNITRRYSPQDFYDDRFIKRLETDNDESIN